MMSRTLLLCASILALLLCPPTLPSSDANQCAGQSGKDAQECEAEILEKGLNGRQADASCADSDDRCSQWAGEGECIANPRYMLHKCQASCLVCGINEDETDTEIGNAPCEDKGENCKELVENGLCEKDPTNVLVNCRKSCLACPSDIRSTGDFGVEQEIPRGRDGVLTAAVIRHTIKYMRKILSEPEHAAVRKICRNKHKHCSKWASSGDCKENPGYMETNCGPACHSCETAELMLKCPFDSNAVNALQPGDLDRMFERIISEEAFAKYHPVVHSRPSLTRRDDPVNAKDVQEGPWVISFENFTSTEECDTLISHGHKQGFKRSRDVGTVKADGTRDGVERNTRTSHNAWCHQKCHNDPIVKQVQERIVEVTGVPRRNSEELQLLRYEPGQFYGSHHDYIPHHKGRQPGVRILTFFLYLNDVEEGGGTRFPLLQNLTVTPKKGKALLWPSVLNDKPHNKDQRTQHEALPVEKGIKYGANGWLHMRDWRTPYDKGCAD